MNTTRDEIIAAINDTTRPIRYENAAEEAWALACGFDSATEYHAASDEAFESELHAQAQFEGNAE